MRSLLPVILLLAAFRGTATSADSVVQLTSKISSDTAKARFLLNWIELHAQQDYPLRAALAEFVIGKSGKNTSLRGYGYLEKANACYFLGQYETALAAYLAALEDFEASGDNKGKGQAFHHLGVYRKKLKKYTEALNDFEKANQFFLLSGDSSLTSSGFNGQGAVWEEQGNFRKAVSFYEMAMAVNEKYHDSIGLSYSYDYLSGCYSNLGEFDKAIRYLESALKIRSAAHDDLSISINLNNLGETYHMMKDQKKAETYYLQSLGYSQKLRFADLMAHTYGRLSDLYAERGQFEEALQYHKKFKNTRDSILNEHSNRQIAEIETKYKTAKKEKENLELKDKTTAQELALATSRNWIIALLSSSLVILLLGTVIYIRYRAKQKERFASALFREQQQKTRAIVEAEEKERIRIARELHDGVGQTLSALRLNLSALEGKKLTGEQFQRLISLSDDSVKEVRSISHIMIPGALQRQGLEAAVREFLSKISEQAPKIDFECHGLEERAEPTIESVLYRIIQEAVQNIIKHAGANQVCIQLIRHSTDISLMIEDDGRGFDLSTLPDGKGIGLKNISTRVESLNGSLTFDTFPGKGTTIMIEIPS